MNKRNSKCLQSFIQRNCVENRKQEIVNKFHNITDSRKHESLERLENHFYLPVYYTFYGDVEGFNYT